MPAARWANAPLTLILCLDVGALHWQVYFETSNGHTQATMGKSLGCWCERAHHPEEARLYTLKSDSTLVDGPWTAGAPIVQGQRMELHAAAAAIRSGMSYTALRRSGEHDVACARTERYLRSLEEDVGAVVAPVQWPVTWKGYTMQAPDPTVKNRHWWIVAPADWGKTKEMGDLFGGSAVCYFMGDKKNRWEAYEGQDLIIYDDTALSFAEISMVTNTIPWKVNLPDVRYVNKFFKENTARNVIVLTNKRISECGYSPQHLPAVYARFTVLDFMPAAIFNV